MKKIAIACDHGGVELKKQIISLLQDKYEFIDCGCNTLESVDYPDYAFAAAKKVVNKEVDFGILICKSGIGMSIAANKVKGIRCALIDNLENAKLCHMHNNANMMAFGANNVDAISAKQFIESYDSVEFETRHQKRIDKIERYEQSY